MTNHVSLTMMPYQSLMKKSIYLVLFTIITFISGYTLAETVVPKSYVFKDDGSIPNNHLPVLIYQHVFTQKGDTGATWLEKTFAQNNWTNSWRWTIYPYHHYHSNTHEVLGVYAGNATVQLGGEKGQKFNISAGDVIILPAGVGHKLLKSSNDFHVVGAYPNGLSPDLMRGLPNERPAADQHIKKVSIPAQDPLYGSNHGLTKIWK
ncbi:cupin domain-containing protein [Acinetobacter stercoris]|nr:cupin domain-containing protein [Acinetobacter stercoris]